MDPPLHLSIRPTPVRVRLAKGAIGYSPAARELGFNEGVQQLWQVILGHPTRFDSAADSADHRASSESGDPR